MKKLLYILCLLPVAALAQTDMNYVLTYTYKDSTLTSNYDLARRSIVYYDAIGRPIQQIAGKMSASSKDIITHIAYDEFGRQAKQYLPYTTSSDNLEFDSAAQANTGIFYNSPAYENTPNPYTESFFENSPLNRVLKQAAPGAPWQGSTIDNNDKTVKFAYKNNLAAEVKRFGAAASWNNATGVYDITFSDLGTYAVAQVYKSVVTDENGSNTEEFKNQEGQVILKRAYNGTEVLDTYYVYDQYGNLSYVLPPAAEGQLIESLCYYYKYDRRNRLVEKKIPGKKWEYTVYDRRNRVMATGPVLSPFGEGTEGWIRSYYDSADRLAFTGWHEAPGINSAARYEIQSHDGDAPVVNVGRGSGIIDNITLGYKPPVVIPSAYKLLTVNYYDTYGWPGGPNTPTATQVVIEQKLMRNPKGLAVGSWARLLDAPTGTTGDMSYTFYDRRGRSVRARTNNYMGGYTQVDTRLDFDGTVEATLTLNQRATGSATMRVTEGFIYTPEDRLLSHTHKIGNAGITELMALNEYDELGRLKRKKVGDTDITGAAALQKVDYTYNVRGWLTGINDVVNLNANSDADLFAFKINYNAAVTNNSVNGVLPLYNGNIAETFWRSATDNVMRSYGYKYDPLNRLTGAYYQKPGSAIVNTHSYDEKGIIYDKNGNIQTLARNGDFDDQSAAYAIDNLVYQYDPVDKNRLVKVIDSEGPSGFNDYPDYSETPDYEYDGFGNLIIDKNKRIINAIKYNHLNLPVYVPILVYDNLGEIKYLYNAAGVKRCKIVFTPRRGTTTPERTVVTDYLDGFQYEDNMLKMFPTAEGYVSHTLSPSTGNSVYKYVYQIKDHLGNTRISYRKKNTTVEIVSEDNYYAFGMAHAGYNNTTPVDVNIQAEKYMYNGKEMQAEHGLNWYDYGARMYDPALARWHNIDPLAEVSRRWSPYTYCYNNPLRFIDPDGMKADDFKDNLSADPMRFDTRADNDDWIKNKETGKVTWDNNATRQDTTPEGYEYIGPSYNGLTVANYSQNAEEPTAVDIAVDYSDGQDGKAEGNWVQTVRTNSPIKEANGKTTYNDPPNDGTPFYMQSSNDIYMMQNGGSEGSDLHFEDSPQRTSNGNTWQAELSPAIKGSNGYTLPVTITYGFEIKDGKAVLSPITITTPSNVQTGTIESYNKGKYRD